MFAHRKGEDHAKQTLPQQEPLSPFGLRRLRED
jgi:hypothetical protein